MATKKKKDMTSERYNEIKKVLKDNKIDSYELENYVMFKDLKYLRHVQRISLSDVEILEMVNCENNKTKFEELLGDLKDKL